MKIILIAILFIPKVVYGLSFHCPTDGTMNDVAALEKAYEKSEIVFLANVEIEIQDTKAPRWRYSIITPTLKGEVEPIGYLEHASEPCEYLEVTEKGVYLVFWHKQNDPVSNKNAKLTVYGGGKVIEEWVVKWAASKTRNKARQNRPAGWTR